jgi:hypothetical protein
MSEEQELNEEEDKEVEELEDTELATILDDSSAEIDAALLRRFLSRGSNISLNQIDVMPTLDLESDLERENARRQLEEQDESKKISYNVYNPDETNKQYLGGATAEFTPKNKDWQKDLTTNERVIEEQKRFTKNKFGSQTFGAEQKSNLEDKYIIMETKDPKKDYNPMREIN